MKVEIILRLLPSPFFPRRFLLSSLRFRLHVESHDDYETTTTTMTMMTVLRMMIT